MPRCCTILRSQAHPTLFFSFPAACDEALRPTSIGHDTGSTMQEFPHKELFPWCMAFFHARHANNLFIFSTCGAGKLAGFVH